jgi:hypothetical protein
MDHETRTQFQHLNKRVSEIEDLLEAIYNLSNDDTFPPKLRDKLHNYLYNLED